MGEHALLTSPSCTSSSSGSPAPTKLCTHHATRKTLCMTRPRVQGAAVVSKTSSIKTCGEITSTLNNTPPSSPPSSEAIHPSCTSCRLLRHGYAEKGSHGKRRSLRGGFCRCSVRVSPCLLRLPMFCGARERRRSQNKPTPLISWPCLTAPSTLASRPVEVHFGEQVAGSSMSLFLSD